MDASSWFLWQLAGILEEHPNPLMLQQPWIPALPQGQISYIPWHQCQASLELSLERWHQEQVLRCSKGLDSASPFPEPWTHPCPTSMCLRSRGSPQTPQTENKDAEIKRQFPEPKINSWKRGTWGNRRIPDKLLVIFAGRVINSCHERRDPAFPEGPGSVPGVSLPPWCCSAASPQAGITASSAPGTQAAGAESHAPVEPAAIPIPVFPIL